MRNPFSRGSSKDEAQKRAEQFNLSLSKIGRIVFRGLGGAQDAIGPKAVFKKGFHWNYSGLVGDVQIYPGMGTVTGAISTSKRPETAMYYAAMQKQNNSNQSAWIYALWCDKGVDYGSSYINNPILKKHGVIRSDPKASFSNAGGANRVSMVRVGEGNQEIIMLNVEAKQVICARFVQHALGDVYLDGPVVPNPDCRLRKVDRNLYDATIALVGGSYGLDERFRFSDFSADRFSFRPAN